MRIEAMSLADSIFIFGLALIIFGPKKLPEIGRQVGKLMLEFRRASNEFKMQIEEELRNVEQADRQKQLAEAAAAKSLTPSSDEATASSESLTVRPPSTGIMESTDSPYQPVSSWDEATEPAAGEPESAGLDTTSTPITPAGDSADSSSDSPAVGPVDSETIQSTNSPNEPVSLTKDTTEIAVSNPDPADLKVSETEPAGAGLLPYPAGKQAGEHPANEYQISADQGLEEQTTNHHG